MKRNNYRFQRQRGFSTAGLILTIGIVGFFLTLIFKMAPAYIDNMGVRSAMKSMLRNTPNIHDLSKAEIRSQIDKYFTINNVRDQTSADLEFDRRKEKTLINLVFETRVHIAMNVDVVMLFKNQIDSSNIQACCTYLEEPIKKNGK